MSRKKIYLLPLIFLIILTVHSQLLAIDFGTQYIKASVVHSGAGKAFSIVENSKSERKFLNALGFFNEQRFYESDTLPKRTKVPQNCFLYSRLLIDFHQNPSLVKVVKKDLFLEYINENIEDQFLAEFVLKNFPQQTRQLTLLEVMTMILKYVKLEAEKYVKGPVKDAVLVLPNYWSIHQRNFILQAAAVAEIYVLSIVSQNTAASINYALSQRNQNKTQNVLFYNVGSNALQMTLVEYKQVLTQSSPKPVESIFIKDDYGKPYVGGLRMDSIICKYFEQIFEQKYKKKLDKRGLIKLLAESNRVKETLSANKQASMFVEGIMDGIDFHSKITRVQFEKRAEQVFNELTSPLKRFLLENDIKADQLHSIQLIGGGSRIPKLQSMIANILNAPKQKIGTHINGDEAMALGGAFFAANSSKKFKVKGMNLYDGFNFDIRLVLRNLDETIQQGTQEYFHKNATIFKKKNRFGLNKEVNFKCTQNLRADLYKVDIETLQEELLKSYEFDQIESFNESDFKLSLVFTIDPIEVVLLKDSKFTYKKDEVQTYLEKVKKPKIKNDTVTGEQQQQSQQQQEQKQQQQQKHHQQQRQDENVSQQQQQQHTNKKDQQKQQSQNKQTKQNKKKSQTIKKDKKKKKQQKPQYETVQKNKTVTKKYQKQIKSKQSFTINKQQQKLNERTKLMLKNYQKAQQKKRILSQARNRLQAVIYETKDKLENEQFIRYSKQSERKHLQKLAVEKQQWHDQSTSKNPDDYKKQYNEIHKPLDRVKRRIVQHYEREHIRDRALAIVKEHLNLTQSVQKGKEWISDGQVEELKNTMEESVKKIKEIFNSMEETAINEDALYQNKDMIKQAQLAKDKYFQLKAKPKPTKKDEKKSQQKNKQQQSNESKQTEQNQQNQTVDDDEL